jgi:O-acetyl-ADP-ribose deacetylase (regulator of RNase III)
MTITFVHGDIFTSGMQTLVNPVNCVGVMGAGLALQFKQKFPIMFTEYVEWCRVGLLKPGEPYLYKQAEDMLPWILNFPTKRHWKDVSLMDDIIDGLKYLKQNYKGWGIKSIAVPPLGCGLGGLTWIAMEPVLKKYLGKLDIPVEIYQP